MPEMLQIEPPQIKPPSHQTQAPAYDSKQTRDEAVAKVAKLVEDCKALIKQNLDQKDIISSFSMIVNSPYKEQIVGIYNAIVEESNYALRNGYSPFHLAGRVEGNSFYFVAGYFDKKADVKATPITAESVSSLSGISKLPDEEKDKLKVTAETLASMKPDEITGAQWEILSARMDKAAWKHYGRRFEFLSLEKKLDVIRRVISPYAEEGQQMGVVYAASGDIHKAAETLSNLKGDCDDLSILYIACVNRLQSEGKMDVKEIRLATMNYFDPKEVKDPKKLSPEELKTFDPKTNGISGHANVLQISAKNNDTKNPEETTFLIDLTYRSQTKDLGPETGYDDLKKKVLAYMNDGRSDEKISESLFEMRLFQGSNAVDAYYHQARGMEFLVERKYEEAIDEFGLAVESAKVASQEYGTPFALMMITLDKLATQKSVLGRDFLEKNKPEEAKKQFDEALLLISKSAEAYKIMPLNLEHLSSEAARHIAVYKYNLGGQDNLSEAKELLLVNIAKAPFKKELYESLWDLYQKGGNYEEAEKTLTELRSNLDNVDNSKMGAIYEIKKGLDGYIKQAQGSEN